MASAKELADFLAGVERRAYKQTVYAVKDDHASMDIVQDSMLKLAEKYPDKPVEEYPMLFQRILQNTMRDYWRRQKVRNLWTSLLSSFGSQVDGEDRDPLDTLHVEDHSVEPSDEVSSGQTIQIIEKAIEKLPTRQREAFVLRYWEEMDVKETAEIMGCSQGSVKTHCSRAVHSLAAMLEKQGLGSRAVTKLGVES